LNLLNAARVVGGFRGIGERLAFGGAQRCAEKIQRILQARDLRGERLQFNRGNRREFGGA
jgi:hypothetical protein